MPLQNYDKAKDEEDRWQESMELNGGNGQQKEGFEGGNAKPATV